MAKLVLLTSKTLKMTIGLFLLAIFVGCANSARVLEEVTPQNPLPIGAPEASDSTEVNPDVAPEVAPAALLPSGQFPATVASPVAVVAPADDDTEAPEAGVATPAANGAPVATPAASSAGGTSATAATSAGVTSATAATSAGGSIATAANANSDHAPFSFFMHDILGGSHPSGRVVTGVVANTDVNNLPFSTPNNQLFPINGGVPLNTVNSVIDNNNYPFLVGLNGSPANTLLQNSGNNDVVNGGGNQPFVSAGQLPDGLTLQQLMFGSITVVDNELTEGHELGSSVIGKAQGFYLASSQDGSSHTLALTALFHSGEHEHHEVEDTISFFGVHRTATPISHLAIIGGTGKYENAKGYATIETDLHHEDQHTTDGVETITHFTLYITP